jgi:shikimate dehydrogenase
MDRYAVIGNPVAHSLSPSIHAMFGRQTGRAIEYGRILAPPGGFDATARRFFEDGGLGANVTLPFKVDAFRFCSHRSSRAERAEAVNVLTAEGNGVAGDNTDGAGLVVDLTVNLHLSLANRRILLVGAGGAARGVVAPLLALAPAELVIANRTAAKAEDLAARFASLGRVAAVDLGAVAGPFDLVVNATSASTRGASLALPEGLWNDGVLAYDMAYGPSAAPFLSRARAAGARTSDGLGMLVEQAAEAFLIWRGVRPDTAPVIASLRAA